MEKRYFVMGSVFGAVMVLVFYPGILEAQEYFGKFPPTPAFNEVGIGNNATIFPNTENNIIAISYADDFFIVTDGSILINITEYP